MVELLWNFIWDQIEHNNFLSGGAVLMVFGALAAYFRQVPGTFLGWLKSRFVMQIEVSDRDQAFIWLAQWLAAQPYSQKRARRLTISTIAAANNDAPNHVNDSETKQNLQIILTPAPGVHYFCFRGRLVALHRERNDGGDQNSSLVTKETFKLSILTRKRSVVYDLLAEARTIAEPPEDDRRKIWTYQRYTNWGCAMKRRPRPIESVILARGIMESILADIKAFQADEQWYIDRGIPYRRTYLLYGPPGSGKSSAVWAIASHLKSDLALVNLAYKGLGDEGLRDCLADMPLNSIGLIEDIDCVFQERKHTEDDDSKITFSGLLNALDGVAASEGRIMFITTNHREKLDPALLRPGRCDVHYEIGHADSSQICRIFDRFFPSATPEQTFAFVDQITPGKVSMAALQGHLNSHKHDIEAAIKQAEELCTS